MSDNETIYWIYLDPDTSDESANQILADMGAFDSVEDASRPGAGPGLTDVAIVVSIVSGVTSTALAAATLAEKILKWREDRRKQGKSTHLRIERIVRETVELTDARDEEITRFVSGNERDSD
jgi:hypothetical protein